MSFSSDTKNNLCSMEGQSRCCIRAEAYALLLFSGLLKDSDKSLFRTKYECVARRIAECTSEACGVAVDIIQPRKTDGSSVYIVSVPYRSDREELADLFGGDENIRFPIFNKQCCFSAFLRGAFIVCGSLTDPKKDYHLEFDIHNKNLCDAFIKLLNFNGIVNAGCSERKGEYLAYFKDGEIIEQILLEMGAQSASFRLLEERSLREVRNKAQRRTNCDQANIRKISNAAGEQIFYIKKICEGDGLDSLPDDLKEIALLRLENPDMSLRELGENLEPKLSRSGVNHRMKRLMEWSKEEK